MRRFFISFVVILFSLSGVRCASGPKKNVFPKHFASAFYKTSRMMIERLSHYHAQNGIYASRQCPQCFEAIGLDASQWENKKFQGLIYTPQGDTLHVRPASGYTIFASDINNYVRIISSVLGWDLIYDLRQRKWFLQYLEPDQQIDISTLRIKKDFPYNEKDYE